MKSNTIKNVKMRLNTTPENFFLLEGYCVIKTAIMNTRNLINRKLTEYSKTSINLCFIKVPLHIKNYLI